MSAKGEGWKWPGTTHSDLDDASLSPFAFRVYHHLRRRAGIKATCKPGLRSIGEACGKGTETASKKRVEAAIVELEKAGLVEIHRGSGRSNTNLYKLRTMEEWRKWKKDKGFQNGTLSEDKRFQNGTRLVPLRGQTGSATGTEGNTFKVTPKGEREEGTRSPDSDWIDSLSQDKRFSHIKDIRSQLKKARRYFSERGKGEELNRTRAERWLRRIEPPLTIPKRNRPANIPEDFTAWWETYEGIEQGSMTASTAWQTPHVREKWKSATATSNA